MPNELEECLAVGMNFTTTKPLQLEKFKSLVRDAGRISSEHNKEEGMGGTGAVCHLATAGYPQSDEVLQLQRRRVACHYCNLRHYCMPFLYALLSLLYIDVRGLSSRL